MFEELVPSVLPLLKKHIRLGYAGILLMATVIIAEYCDNANNNEKNSNNDDGDDDANDSD